MLVADAEADRSISVAFSGSPLPQEVRAINSPWELIMPRTSWGRGCVSLRVFPPEPHGLIIQEFAAVEGSPVRCVAFGSG